MIYQIQLLLPIAMLLIKKCYSLRILVINQYKVTFILSGNSSIESQHSGCKKQAQIAFFVLMRCEDVTGATQVVIPSEHS